MKNALKVALLIVLPFTGQAEVPRVTKLGEQQQAIHKGVVLVSSISSPGWKRLPNQPPSLAENAETNPRFEAWDGEWAYREIRSNDGPSKAQKGHMEMTLNGPHWFWQASVALPEGARALGARDGRLLVRVDFYSPDNFWKPGNARGDAKESKVVLEWVDLISGEEKVIEEIKGSTYFLEFATVSSDGDFFIIHNTGKIEVIRDGSWSVTSVVDDFWKDLPIKFDTVPKEFAGEMVHFQPRFQSLPFFDLDGSMLLAFEAAQQVTFDKAHLEKMFNPLNPRLQGRIEQLRKYGLYPFKDEGLKSNASRFVVLRFDPSEKKVQVVDEDRYIGLTRPEEDSGSKVPTLINPPYEGFTVGSNRKITSFKGLSEDPPVVAPKKSDAKKPSMTKKNQESPSPKLGY